MFRMVLIHVLYIIYCILYVYVLLIKKYFPSGDLSLIKTCCWRADHEILIHDGESQSEFNIRICLTTHVLISDNSPVRKIISILTLNRMKMQGYCDVTNGLF